MKKYKFHIGYPSSTGRLKDIENYLESMQDKGWEFMGITPSDSGLNHTREKYIFRREIKEEKEKFNQ